ncbi:MAG: hypothetical protein RR048_00475, partial [Oscillospiraceae bacterium]
MNNNFKQAFNEVFGKGKDGNSQDKANSSENNNQNEDLEFVKPSPSPQAFEELKPTGETISDADKKLIDKKAEEFAASLGMNLGQSVKHKSEQTSETQSNGHSLEDTTDNIKAPTEQPNPAGVGGDDNNTNSDGEQVNYKPYDFKAQFMKNLEVKANAQSPIPMENETPQKEEINKLDTSSEEIEKNYKPFDFKAQSAKAPEVNINSNTIITKENNAEQNTTTTEPLDADLTPKNNDNQVITSPAETRLEIDGNKSDVSVDKSTAQLDSLNENVPNKTEIEDTLVQSTS